MILVQKTLEFTEEQVADLIDQAIYGAAQYWADDFHLTEDFDGTMGGGVVQDYMLEVHDSETEKWHKVVLANIVKALEDAVNTDLDNYDMYDAERILQVAIFGEEIYG